MALEFDLDPPECARCETEMEFRYGGSTKSVPVVGDEVEYRQFACPGCGQAARYERSDPTEEWSRTGV